jgi:hypothetical protein
MYTVTDNNNSSYSRSPGQESFLSFFSLGSGVVVVVVHVPSSIDSIISRFYRVQQREPGKTGPTTTMAVLSCFSFRASLLSSRGCCSVQQLPITRKSFCRFPSSSPSDCPVSSTSDKWKSNSSWTCSSPDRRRRWIVSVLFLRLFP